jgi:hypothetical protein
MNQVLATREENLPGLTAINTDVIQTRRATIMHVMESMLKENVHYGKIPGCPKPSLYQPGAEVLIATFRLGWRHETIEVVTTDELISFTVRTVIFDQQTGTELGDALGSASTDEEKYCWRRSFPEEWDATPPEHRRMKWRKGNPATQEIQVRTSPADLKNTVLAMASKRADVRATRAALGASDIFDVGADDLPEDIRNAVYGVEETPDPAKVAAAKRTEQRAHAGVSGTTRPAATGAAGGYKIPFGKNKGKTFAEVGENSAQWYAEKAQQDDVRAAAQAYLDSLNGGAQEAAEVPPPTDAPGEDITDPFAQE